jgi:drug/metabolite transporter (DMT)-like permease
LNDNTKGALAIIFSSIAFSVMGMLVKYTGEATIFQQVFFRNLVMLVFAGFLVKSNNATFFGKKENRKLLFFRSFFGFMGVMTSFYATRNLYLGDAQALSKISPFVVTIFAVIFLKERINRYNILALIIAFLGTIVIVNPKFDSRLLPSLLGIASAVFGGIAYVIIGIISKKDSPEDKSTIIFMFAFWSLIFSFPFIGDVFILEYKTLFFLFLVGVCASIAQFLVTLAYSIGDASKISIFDYVSLIVSPILGWIVFRESLTKNSYMGIILILSAGYISYLNARIQVSRNKIE